MRSFAFKLYLMFVVSWFLHMGARWAPVGIIRLDLLLIVLISFLIFFSKPDQEFPDTPGSTERMIKIMFVYIILSLPLVQWPGSVIRSGIPNYTKAVVFYFFTIALVTDEKKLRTFMFVFLFCQAIRVIEPVAMHLTSGYWGSQASMANWEAMDRLSGAPSDIINPNGLAFVILMVFPFLHYLASLNWKNKVVYVGLAPVLIYALLLTASRTGFVCFLVIVAGIWWKSKRKMAITASLIITAIVAFGFMSGNLKDRYLSLVSKDTKNARTAQGRIKGIKANIEVGMRKPIVGHGLGTSLEANANYGGYGQISHDLYCEIFEELGLTGLVIFFFLMRSIIVNFQQSIGAIKAGSEGDRFLYALTNAMQVWIVMNIIFSLASFGFSSYEWYLFAGLSVVLKRICDQRNKDPLPNVEAAEGQGDAYFGAASI